MASPCAVSSNLLKKTIPLCLYSSSFSKRSSIFISHNSISFGRKSPTNRFSPSKSKLQAQLHGSSDPPAKTPPEFPSVPGSEPSYPAEVPVVTPSPEIDPIPPEGPTPTRVPGTDPSPDFPVPPAPSPPKPDMPEIPVPPLPPQPPDVLPPQPLEVPPPPSIPPEITPPTGPFVF